MEAKPKNLILLTGAGFTHNFDGFLAREMWSKIFNNPLVQSQAELRQLLLKDFNFESAYFSVFSSSHYSESVKQALRVAVETAYKDLDETIKKWSFNSSNPTALDTNRLGKLLGLISNRGSNKGWFFTLNQDLYMERKNNYRSPGASFGTFIDKEEGGVVNLVTLPKSDEMEKVKASLCNASYIKLHGSYGWISSRGGNQMVIGKNKSEDISKEPLLNWYSGLFQDLIYEGNKKLLVIGYGFGDDHINDILLKGIQEHGLSLYVINPTDPESFKNRLEGKPSHSNIYEKSKYSKIWEGVKGYFPYSLRQIFPPDQSETTVAKDLIKILSA
jgi:hypothetical protein